MLTDLSWLAKGKSFPPESEKTRINEYRKNDKLFMTELPPEWEEAFKRISARLGKRPTGIDTIFNYQQLISRKPRNTLSKRSFFAAISCLRQAGSSL